MRRYMVPVVDAENTPVSCTVRDPVATIVYVQRTVSEAGCDIEPAGMDVRDSGFSLTSAVSVTAGVVEPDPQAPKYEKLAAATAVFLSSWSIAKLCPPSTHLAPVAISTAHLRLLVRIVP